jgi:hypothetical protein
VLEYQTDIIIPTCKGFQDVAELIAEVEQTATGPFSVIATCKEKCAAANRNIGLERSRAGIVIMIDDDITGLPVGWNQVMAQVLIDRPDYAMVSARLMNPNGTPGQMLGDPVFAESGTFIVTRQELPTACIAVRRNDIRFDERYIGSGFEDTDYCAQLRQRYPDAHWVVTNDVKVIHKNEMKNQGANFAVNLKHYESKWGPHPFHSRGA